MSPFFSPPTLWFVTIPPPWPNPIRSQKGQRGVEDGRVGSCIIKENNSIVCVPDIYYQVYGYKGYYFYFQNSEVKFWKKEKLNFLYIRNRSGTLGYEIGTRAFPLLSAGDQGMLKENGSLPKLSLWRKPVRSVFGMALWSSCPCKRIMPAPRNCLPVPNEFFHSH